MKSLAGAPQRYAPYRPAVRSLARRPACSAAQQTGAQSTLQIAGAASGQEVVADDLWNRLPLELTRPLAAAGVQSTQALRAMPFEALLRALRWTLYSSFERLLTELRAPGGPSLCQIFRLLSLRAPTSADHIRHLCQDQTSDVRPTPFQNMSSALALQRSGLHPAAVCDARAAPQGPPQQCRPRQPRHMTLI